MAKTTNDKQTPRDRIKGFHAAINYLSNPPGNGKPGPRMLARINRDEGQEPRSRGALPGVWKR